MKKILFNLAFLFSIFFSANAQNVTFSNNSALIILSADLLNANLDYIQNLKVTNTQNVSFSGSIVSEESIRIFPTSIYSIAFVPSSYSTMSTSECCGTTVIKSKGTGVGSPPPILNVYPNPVQTTLTFNVPNNLAIGYKIFDLNGVLKKTLSFSPITSGTINVGDLTNGIYFLDIILSNSQNLSIQFIKN